MEWFDPFRCQKRVVTFIGDLHRMTVEIKKKFPYTALQVFTFSL